MKGTSVAKNMNVVWRMTLLTLCCLLSSGRVLAVDLADAPLFVEGQLPGNLVLVPSVETPTVVSVANVGSYQADTSYAGYFDADKCYKYHYSDDPAEQHFYPSSMAADHQCTGSGEWGGNFLAWAGTQTIDTFRLALTGGNRYKDEAGDVWLQKARHFTGGYNGEPHQSWADSYFPDRRIPHSGSDTTVVSGATPFESASLYTRIKRQGHTMVFRLNNTVHDSTSETDAESEAQCPDGLYLAYDNCYEDRYWNDGEWKYYNYKQEPEYVDRVVFYNPEKTPSTDFTYRVYMRVKVCDPSVKVESFCRKYEGANNWKPEGVIQQYSRDMRYAVFGYLNQPSMYRDGGVLRAPMKYVGDEKRTESGWEANTNKEWDETTGAFIQNPDAIDSAMGRPIAHSGVINYINQFGELNNKNFKEFDPVSELYYVALRYVRNFGNISEYTDDQDASDQDLDKWVDGFPVHTSWQDPIQYSCQNNVVLGIGDVYTHRDKNLPGNSSYRNDEPKTNPTSGDNAVNVVTETNRVGALEEIGDIGSTNSFSGRNNSAYMAGLAYWANTRDVRPDLPGDQRVKTHWVDVMERQKLEAPKDNQYYLAAKYGGFEVPEDFDPENPVASLILEELWHTNGETLVSGSYSNGVPTNGTAFKRPDNYYLAGQAEQMVTSLQQAFRTIVNSMLSSSSSVVANSTRLDTDSLVYQARFNTGKWSGDLLAFELEENGDVKTKAKWRAADKLDAMALADRNVLVGTANGAVPLDASHVNGDANLAAWLKGDRSQELSRGGSLRDRDSRLGDIINSNPAYSGRQGYGYQHLGDAIQAPKYNAFKATQNGRREMVLAAANDGMVHGFDADTGEELFAYIPSFVLDDLPQLANPNYSHQYLLDGSIVVTDAWLESANDDGATGGWRTLAVGTEGAAGRGIYVLDITDPENPELVWEKESDANGLMGEGINEVSVVPTLLPAQGQDPAKIKWVLAMGNGYNASDETARLLLFDLEDGSLNETVPVGVAGANGLSAITAINSTGSKPLANTIYGGDLKGDLWKFDQNSKDGTWKVAIQSGKQNVPLFDGVATRPITARPDLAKVPLEEDADPVTMVYFGTGKYLEATDVEDLSLQALYGIIDGGNTLDQDDLLEQTIEFQANVEFGDNEVPVRVVTANVPSDKDNSDDSGWVLELVYDNNLEGERSVVRPVIHEAAVLFTTIIPSGDACSGGGSSWVMALDKATGGRIGGGVFDLNDDGVIDEKDFAKTNQGTLPPSGFGSDKLLTRPNILGGPGGVDVVHSSDSSGDVTRFNIKGSGELVGRHSWRQLR